MKLTVVKMQSTSDILALRDSKKHFLLDNLAQIVTGLQNLAKR
jgi:hypothetical protein